MPLGEREGSCGIAVVYTCKGKGERRKDGRSARMDSDMQSRSLSLCAQMENYYDRTGIIIWSI